MFGRGATNIPLLSPLWTTWSASCAAWSGDSELGVLGARRVVAHRVRPLVASTSPTFGRLAQLLPNSVRSWSNIAGVD